MNLNFSKHQSGSFITVNEGAESSNLIKNILICVLKLNESLTGLERQEGE